MRGGKVEIDLKPSGLGTVIVDGVDISSYVCAVTITARCGRGTTASVELVDVKLSAEAEQAVASILPKEPQP